MRCGSETESVLLLLINTVAGWGMWGVGWGQNRGSLRIGWDRRDDGRLTLDSF